MTVTMKVDGLKEVQRRLKALGPAVERRVLARSVNAGARVIRAEARTNVAEISAELAKAVISKKRRGPRETATYDVRLATRPVNRTINASTQWGADLARAGWALIGNFFEYGTSKMPSPKGKAFMGRAYESKKEGAVKEIRTALLKGVDEEAKKLER